ncbi:hypothetical protein GCM10011506_15920 [Marivirga lumbricoides]|uniref:Uncharacterized protein n=1 Tax=Marivirga lumbricoides TaxID=1046115 RepID=A0ABQ1LX54_9BACT|nr:hypothetical protein GCM10011506_15920 [Marivirga lumbricoides]
MQTRTRTDFKKEKFVQWLSANKSSIENLGYDKINQLFNTSFNEFTPNNLLSQTVLNYFSITNNYNAIIR